MYSLNPVLYGSVTVVPSVLIEKYIKMASFCAVKSLLWILKNQSGNFSVSDIAKGVGSSEADVKEALDYWINEGVLTDSQSNHISPSPEKSDSYLIENRQVEPVKPKIESKMNDDDELLTPTFEQVTARINESKDLANLINQAQIMLGRTTGYDFNAKLIQIVDGYGLPFDVILRLIQYCVDIGKASNAFIFGVAKNWFKQEITTLELADRYINEHTGAQNIYREFRIATGINAPNATPKQEEFFIKWKNLGFSVEMMVLAYNTTVENTGKISFAYMDKILLSWSKNAYKTPEDVENANRKFTEQKKSESGRSYDINQAIEQAENDELIYEKKPKKKRGDTK